MSEFDAYVGIPWVIGGHTKEGADCWGLVSLVLREVFDIDFDRYEGAEYTGEELARIIKSEEQSGRWLPTDSPQAGDVVTLRRHGETDPSHVGIMVGLDTVLHSLNDFGNGSASIHSIRLIERLLGRVRIYRYADNHNAT